MATQPAQPTTQPGQAETLQADLDRVIRVAAGALRAPIVAVALAGAPEPRLLASAGAPPGWHKLLAACWAGCAPDEVLVIEQLRASDLPAGLAALAGQAGALLELPLVGAGGALLGYRGLADRAPRMWQPAELQQAEDLAGLAASTIELCREAQRLRQTETMLRELEQWAQIISDNRRGCADHDRPEQPGDVSVSRAVGADVWLPCRRGACRSVELLVPERLRQRQ